MPLKENIFSFEGKDHVVCRVCNYKARDLTRHLFTAQSPHLSLLEYRKMFPDARLVCTDVDKKRRNTSLNLHGSETYRNRDAQSIGVRIAYADGTASKKVRATKLARYGDGGYVNSEKRKKTMIEKYGVANPMKNPALVQKAAKTRALLYKDNPIIRPPRIEKTVLEDLHGVRKMTMGEIGKILGVSEAVVSYWARKHGVKVVKRIVVPKNLSGLKWNKNYGKVPPTGHERAMS
jgi:hypothetical protein